MVQPKIGTVVLNYKTYRDALACVASLKAQSYPNHEIVVVENGSGNESAQVLKETFADDPQVHLIISEENLGFARGNNLGIRHAHETLGCDYVFVLNSDTIVPDGVFAAVLAADAPDIGAISPSVAGTDGKLQLPSENSDDILLQVKRREKGLRLARVLSLPIVRDLYRAYCAKKPPQPEPEYPERFGKYVLQGCSYFLTPAFFRYYTQIYPKTFLYWEEIDLLLYLQKAGLHSVAVSTPPIVHKEACSIKTAVGAAQYDRRKLQFSLDSYRASKPMFKMSCAQIQKNYC